MIFPLRNVNLMRYIRRGILVIILFSIVIPFRGDIIPYNPKNELISKVDEVLKQYNSPLSADILVDHSIRYEVPISLILAQGILESGLGTKGQAKKNYSVWGVGAYNSNSHHTKKRTGYKNFDDSIEPYIRLVRSYIDYRGYPDILYNYSKKHRYAQDPKYEVKLRSVIKNINSELDFLYIKVIEYEKVKNNTNRSSGSGKNDSIKGVQPTKDK